MLAAYGLPVPRRRLCSTAAEAVTFAEEIGYPVVLRAVSPQIVHKTDAQAVVLNVASTPRKSAALTTRCSGPVRLASGRRDPRGAHPLYHPAGHEVILRPPRPGGRAGADVRTGGI